MGKKEIVKKVLHKIKRKLNKLNLNKIKEMGKGQIKQM